MNNLEKLENALMALEGFDVEELPEELQTLFIQATSVLMHIDAVLENGSEEQ